jgi:hypothetical protein
MVTAASRRKVEAMEGNREEDAYQAKLDAAVQDSINDYLRPDTGFFSPTEDPEWLDSGYVGEGRVLRAAFF